MRREMDQAVATFNTEMTKLKSENDSVKRRYEEVKAAKNSEMTQLQQVQSELAENLR